MRTALYRLYDRTKTLLYVGVTKDFGKRWNQHASSKPWWPDVQHQEVAWYETLDAALAAEATAIKDEMPRHNSTKQDPPKAPTATQHTKPRQVRGPDALWEAFERVCALRGTTRAEVINEQIMAFVDLHGDDEDKALLAQADAELEERRSRKGGRPRNS